MTNKILSVIGLFFNNPFIYPNILDGWKTYQHIFDDIRKLILIFKLIRAEKGTRVALVGYNSYTWLIVLLSILIRKLTCVIIHPKNNHVEIAHQINHSEATIVFIDMKLCWDTYKQDLPLVNYMFECTSSYYGLFYAKDSSSKEIRLLDKIRKCHPKALIITPDRNDIKRFKKMLSLSDGADVAWLQYGSNVNSDADVKIMTYKNLVSILSSLHTNFRLGTEITVTPKNMLFAENPILYLLHPFFTNSSIMIKSLFNEYVNNLKLNPKIIIDSKTLTDIWYDYINDIFKTKFMSWVYYQRLLKPIVWLVMLIKIRSIFPKRKVKEIVVVNNQLSILMKKLFKSLRLPMSYTYDFDLGCGIVTYNKLGSNPLSIGRPIKGIKLAGLPVPGINLPSELLVHGDNVNDVSDNWIKTNNVVLSVNNDIIIIGEKKPNLNRGYTETWFLENYEKIFNSLKYVKETLLIKVKNNVLLLIIVDETHPFIKGFTMNQMEEYFERLRPTLNSELPNYFQIDIIRIYPFKFYKTITGKIKRHLYQINEV